MPTAIVSGALANKPGNGGEAWTRLSWALGLRRLGFDVHLVEEISIAGCVDESGRPVAFEHSANRAFFERTVRDFDLGDRATLLCDGGRETVGRSLAELEDVAAEAEALFDISGHLRAPGVFAGPRSRVYVDLDPGFTQAWHADDSVEFRLGRHDHYVTVGLNVGREGCPIPDCGLAWAPTLPPVLLEQWPVGQRPGPGSGMRFTTVASWRNPYGAPRIGNRETTLKHHQFRRFLELPAQRPEVRFELALGIEDGDRRDLEALAENGWLVVASQVASSPASFREYVAGSSGEFSVAQGVYAETRSGWFSDRTAAYLASGRPALVQDTGIGDRLPVGEGLLTFTSIDEAAAGARRIAADPVGHGEAARELAAQHLDSDRVLGALLERLGIGG